MHFTAIDYTQVMRDLIYTTPSWNLSYDEYPVARVVRHP